MTENLKDDQLIQEGIFRSCLILDTAKKNDKNNIMVSRLLLSILFEHKVPMLREDLETKASECNVNKDKTKRIINDLISRRFIRADKDYLYIPDDKVEESNKMVNKFKEDFRSLIDYLYHKVVDFKDAPRNPQAIRTSIHRCLAYYYRIAGYSFFGVDRKLDAAHLEKLPEIALKGLAKADRHYADILISEIGNLIDNPTDAHRATLNHLAHIYVNGQIISIDPALSNFKAGILANKKFVLDTDVVLTLMKEYCPEQHQYNVLKRVLLELGCELYVPKEVVTEVYHNIHAAVKGFAGVIDRMKIQTGGIKESFHNAFLEDFYEGLKAGKVKIEGWRNYIDNCWYGQDNLEYTAQLISDKLGPQVYVEKIPNDVMLKEDEQEKLEKLKGAILDYISKTHRGQERKEDINEDLARIDALLYLSVRKLNIQDIGDKRNRIIKDSSSLLSYRYYLLSSSSVSYHQAENLDLPTDTPDLAMKIICNPGALAVYLESIGKINQELDYLNLFGNPFNQNAISILKDELEDLIKAGINLNGKNLSKVKTLLRDNIEGLITAESPEEYETMLQRYSAEGITPSVPYLRLKAEKEQSDAENESLRSQLRVANATISKLTAPERIRNAKNLIKRKSNHKVKKAK